MTRNNARITLFATSVSFVLVILDTSIVNVALESIAQGLATDVTGLQWIATAYIIAFASLLLSGGALGDIFGARRIYLMGLALFTAASLISGCAPSMAALIAGRILQGIGAALLVPCALSLLTHAYPDDTARAKAIAWWAAWGGAAQVLGPLVGGLLLAIFDWRTIFLVNLPICTAGIWLTLRIDGHANDRTSERTGERTGRRLDLPGQLSAALAMILLNIALIEGAKVGWRDDWIVVALLLSALSALVFALIERTSTSPILPLALFADPVFSWICVTVLMSSITFFGMLFVLSLYFLQGAGYTPLQTGLAMLPFALMATAGNLASARLAHRISPMSLMLAGSAIRLIGFAGLAFLGTDVPYPLVALELALLGFGSGLGTPMTISVLMATVDKKYSGAAAGISRATGQLGSALGVAIFGAFLADPQHIAEGTRLAAGVSTALAVMGTLVIWHLCRQFDRAIRP